ncbi:MAG: VOC family protein [Acidobacteriota bacterium]
MIKGGMATIYVSDMDRAVDFYSQTLGLRILFRAQGHFASIDAGNGLVLGLHPVSEHSPQAGKSGSISVGFNVTEPIDEVVASLKERGVRFRGPVQADAEGEIQLAFFGDPDDNDLYLCEASSDW